MRETKRLLRKACHHLGWDRLLQRLEWMIELWAITRVVIILVLVIVSILISLTRELRNNRTEILEADYTSNK
jgi:hypothetical protein